MENPDWAQYVDRTLGDDTVTHASHLSGVSARTIARWRKGEPPKPRNALAFARAYRRNPVETFLHADLLTPEEAAQVIRIERVRPDELSNRELARIITQRLCD